MLAAATLHGKNNDLQLVLAQIEHGVNKSASIDSAKVTNWVTSAVAKMSNSEDMKTVM